MDTNFKKRGGRAASEYIPMVNIAVCDDNQPFLRALKPSIEALMQPFDLRYQVVMFDSPAALLAYPGRGELDILFLDVEMPEMDGFEVARLINTEKTDVKIIFLTSYPEFIQAAFKVKAFRYLYKPYTDKELGEALGDAIREMLDSEGVLATDVRGTEYFIKYRNIFYIESMGDGSMLCAEGNYILTTRPLRQWLGYLDERFFRCHKSYVVNLQWIRSISGGNVEMEDNKTLPVAVRSKVELKNAFRDYVRAYAKYL